MFIYVVVLVGMCAFHEAIGGQQKRCPSIEIPCRVEGFSPVENRLCQMLVDLRGLRNAYEYADLAPSLIPPRFRQLSSEQAGRILHLLRMEMTFLERGVSANRLKRVQEEAEAQVIRDMQLIRK